jgi:methylphosphotriester-DNA--protein-cysteine methyltransferase
MRYIDTMNLNREICYQAVLSRDRRFDGWFFAAVTSTGIYCRPACPVRPPKFANCRFYANAAHWAPWRAYAVQHVALIQEEKAHAA